MSKFKVKMKLTGFELEIEGNRDDIPLISQNIGSQMTGLLNPAGAIIEGEVFESTKPKTISVAPLNENFSAPKKTKRKSTGGQKQNTGEKAQALDWKHEPKKFGTPKQSWTAVQKAMWTLYVVNEVLQVSELSSAMIADTFNKHFRQAGEVKGFNLTRDLGRLKVKGLLGENTTQAPPKWYLLDEGIKTVQTLIANPSS